MVLLSIQTSWTEEGGFLVGLFFFSPGLDWKNGFRVEQAEPRPFVVLSACEVCMSVGGRGKWWLSSSTSPYSYFVRQALTM